jgi:hypothetical protein
LPVVIARPKKPGALYASTQNPARNTTVTPSAVQRQHNLLPLLSFFVGAALALLLLLSLSLLPLSLMPPSANSMIPLMEESGQTDEERRCLRQKQRALQNVILTQAEAMENPCDQVFGKVREENNDLFQKVFFTREAVLDGENLHMISERAAKQVESLVKVSIPQYYGALSRVSVSPERERRVMMGA